MSSSQPAEGQEAIKSEPVSSEKSQSEKHITDYPLTLSNWYKQVNWLNVFLIIGIPLFGLVQSIWTPLLWKTALFTVFYYYCTGLGITAGYHRLWSHASYTASTPLKIIWAAFGGGAVQGSIRWWARDHRAHHRYTDTDKDPYWVGKGLLYAHLGWMVMKQNPKRIGRTDISDLNNDWIVRWQHKHYLAVAFSMGLVLPCLVTGLGWGDWKGGFIYAGILRIFAIQQAIFCLNSLAHWLGEQPFDDRNSPRDHVFTALMTMGEGYHNFHHEFPSDFRNAIEWWQYDPTKWIIWVAKQVGLASDLKTFRSNEIEVGRFQQQQKKLDVKRSKLNFGIPLEQLPVIEWDDYAEQCNKDGRSLVAIAGVVHDVAEFIDEHPGGRAMITSGIGKDATQMFNGGVYLHSNAAHNVLATMRVGIIRGGMEVEVWRRESEQKDPPLVQGGAGNMTIRAGHQVTKI